MLGGTDAPAARHNLRKAGTRGPMWKQNTSFRKPRPSTNCPELTEQSSGASEPCPSGKQTIDNPFQVMSILRGDHLPVG